jgi:hypothetical protein
LWTAPMYAPSPRSSRISIQGVLRLDSHDLATVENAKRLNPRRLGEFVL